MAGHPCWRELRSGGLFHEGPPGCTAPPPESAAVLSDEDIEPIQRESPVGADEERDLSADPPEVSQGPGVGDGPPSDHEHSAAEVADAFAEGRPIVIGQERQRKSRSRPGSS